MAHFVKKLFSLLFSLLLITITVLCINSPKLVGTADRFFLLEKRHPGYWEYLRQDFGIPANEFNQDETGYKVYFLSKSNLSSAPSEDVYFFFNQFKYQNSDKKVMIDFLDGTGICLYSHSPSLCYGKLDDSTNDILAPFQKIECQGKTLRLEDISNSSEAGIAGIDGDEPNFADIDNVYRYLAAMRSDKYSFIISAKDEASHSVNDYLKLMLNNLGLTGNFGWRESYIAVLRDGQVDYEAASQKTLTYQQTLDDIEIKVISSGAEAENLSSILIDGTEYSSQLRGLNIVTLEHGKVIDSVNFDTCDESLTCNR